MIQIQTHILISSDLVFFATVVGKVNILVVGIIGAIYLQKSGLRNHMQKECYGQFIY